MVFSRNLKMNDASSSEVSNQIPKRRWKSKKSSKFDQGVEQREPMEYSSNRSGLQNPTDNTREKYRSIAHSERTDQEATSPFVGNKCSERLFSLSKEQQKAGKMRREAIAKKRWEKENPVVKDYGVLPLSRASDFYKKDAKWLLQRESYLNERRSQEENKMNQSSDTGDRPKSRQSGARRSRFYNYT